MGEKQKLCMFCGKDESFGEMNKEHFVPRALWDGNRPQHTMTVLAHKTCNSAFSDDNDYFRDTLVFDDAAGRHPEVQRLRKGTIARKFDKRPGQIVNLLDKAIKVPVQAKDGSVTNSGVLVLDRKRINQVLYNVMKGLFYAINGRPLPTEWQWGVEKLEEVPIREFEVIFNQMTPWSGFGDDVFLYRVHFDLDEGKMYCLMKFYDYRTYMGWALSDEYIRTFNEQNPNDVPS